MRGEHNRQAGRQAGPQLYADVTAKIVAELEAGRVPWVQPWDEAKAGPGLPRNAATGNTYSGINILILWSAVIERCFAAQNWLTFRQALSLGGHVRKGETGVTLVYADRFTPKAERERAAAEGEEARRVPFLKRFTVFNVAQCDGLPGDLLAVRSAGAYGFTMSSNYNSRPRVAEIMVDGDTTHLVRARETLTDLWRGEQVLPA